MPAESLTIRGWLMRGAIREDDVLAGFAANPPPQDDPYTTGDVILDNRPFHHFYDPRNDRGLSKQVPILGTWVSIGHKAPDWGIGASDAFADENAADPWRRNHFTVFDAREAMFRALTGMNGSGSRAIGSGGSTPSTAADKLAVRKAYWATTFRALGDLVHLIQDMAQPQHTRNDPHAGKDYDGTAGPLGHKSFYESYIEARATQGTVNESNGNRYTPAPLAYDTGYPIPRFNDYASYFSTRNADAGVASRRGMADYSNRGFFSIGKNLGQGDYDLPPNSISGGFYTPEQRAIGTDGTTVHILKGSVTDANTNTTEPDVPLTAFGAWNDALQQVTGEQSFTLIRENYDAMADRLVPRAVAYSAGLIDYFFRGRMEISLPDEGVYAILDHAVEKDINDGFRKVKLKLVNTTPAIEYGQNSYVQDMAGGTLRAVVKFRRNGCYMSNLYGEPGLSSCNIDKNRGPEEIVVSDAIAVQSLDSAQSQPFTFKFQNAPIPVNAINVSLQVVYRGALGSELDAVVVATRDISEPTFVVIMNNTDYHLVDGIYYRPDAIQNNPDLMDRVGDVSRLAAENQSCSFFFSGQRVGTAELPPSTFVRFGVLADNPSLMVNVQSHTWGFWKILNVQLNKHQYDPETGFYQVREISSSRGAANHALLIYLKWSGVYDEASALNLEGLDNLLELEPRQIEILF